MKSPAQKLLKDSENLSPEDRQNDIIHSEITEKCTSQISQKSQVPKDFSKLSLSSKSYQMIYSYVICHENH